MNRNLLALLLASPMLVSLLTPPAVAQCNQAPVDESEEVVTIQPFAIDVLANAQDPDGDPLEVSVTATTCPATTVTSSHGLVSVTPTPRFYGDCSVAYQVRDESGLTDSSFVTISIPAAIFESNFEIGDTSEWGTP